MNLDRVEKTMHVLVTDSENGKVVLDADCEPGEKLVSTAVGSDANGVCYRDVTVWIDTRNTVHPWETADDAVFVQWTDESTSAAGGHNPGIVHTSERPLPGGGVGRFLVAVT